MSKILDNLYLGSFKDSRNHHFLKRCGITHIVTVGVELKPLFPDEYKYLHIPAYDTPSYKLIVYFDQIADFMHKAMEEEKGTVFVHCYMGISRSTTSILAYLIKYHQIPPLKGRLFVRSKRGIIWPNDGFMNQLGRYAKKLGIIDERSGTKSLANSTMPSKFPSLIKKEEVKEPQSATISATPSMTISTLSGRGWKTGTAGETKSVNKDYYCKNCGIKVFNSQDIEHDMNKETNVCNTIYLKNMPWISFAKSTKAKIFCPNTKCNSILGVADQNGGKCPCGKSIEKMYAVYPLRIVASKAK